MMIYFKSENGKVLMQTESKELAADYNLVETCEDGGLEQAYDGSWYIKGHAPAKPYTELRAEAYPPLPDQLDMLYWDKVNGTNNWENLIASIKAKYPKG